MTSKGWARSQDGWVKGTLRVEAIPGTETFRVSVEGSYFDEIFPTGLDARKFADTLEAE